MSRRNRLADLLRFYDRRPSAEDVVAPIEDERDWIDVDDESDADDGAGLPPARTFGPGARPLTWKEHLGALRHAMESTRADAMPDWPPGREILYVIDPVATVAQGSLVVEVLCRDPRKRGGFTQLRRLGLRRTQLDAVPDPMDRRILALLGGTRDPDRLWLDSHPSYGAVSHRYLVPHDLHESLMPLICGTGHGWLRASPADADVVPLAWDDGPAWTPSLDVRADQKTGYYLVTGSLLRSGEQIELSAVRLLLAGGLVFSGERVARLDDGGAFPWIAHLRRHGSVRVPLAQGPAFLETLLKLPRLPRLDLPDELKYEDVATAPRPRLRVRAAPSHWGTQRLRAALSFEYDGAIVRMDRDSTGIFQADRRRFLKRDVSAERVAVARLRQAGFGERLVYEGNQPKKAFDLPARDLPRAVGQLVKEGWHVEADGRLYRQPGAFNIEVSSGIDWFELHGTAEFGSTVAKLPDLLAALSAAREHGAAGRRHLRRAARGVAAGAMGCSPPSARRQTITCGSGATRSASSTPSCPRCPRRARTPSSPARGRSWRRSKASSRGKPPMGFVGRLRGYQRDGLGWLYFIERFGFGGVSGRRHGTRQDRAGPRHARGAARGARGRCRYGRSPARALARRGSAVAGVQLEGRRRLGSRPSSECSITRAPAAAGRASTSRTTISCSRPTARCAATRPP